MIYADDLVQGRSYFFVVYYDQICTIPLIKTYIYIGKINSAGEIAEDEWNFQDPESYFKYGQFTSLSQSTIKKAKVEKVALDEGSLLSLYDLNGLIIELAEIQERIRRT